MGLDNREYLREESRRYEGGGGFSFGGRGGGFGASSPVTMRLLLITIAVFLAQSLFTQPVPDDSLSAVRAAGGAARISFVEKWCALDPDKVLSGQVWRLLTYGFCHDRHQLFHILFNMLLFFFFGKVLESMYGSKEFLAFYLVSIVLAGIAFVILNLVTGTPGQAIGASGGVMAVMVLYALHFPRQTMLVFFIIPVEIRFLVAFLALADLYPFFQMLVGNGTASDGIAHAAHLGGLGFGFLYGRMNWRLAPLFGSLDTMWKAKRRGLRVVSDDADDPYDRNTAQPTDSKLAEQMDAILQKISEQGEQSLTAKERRTLEKASRELRNRRP